jgi:hypothetical protein
MSEISPVASPNTETGQQNDKEYNFAQIRKQLEQERLEKAQIRQELDEVKKIAQERMYKPPVAVEDDDIDDEPYIDKKTLKKHLVKFDQSVKTNTEEVVNNAVQRALADERKNNWLKGNPDFYEVMGHAQTFADRDPELAETILSMPDTFERQKLVYKNIKALGLHKKEEPKPSIQETIDKNRRSPYYQPSMTGSPPYASQGDFSPGGQKNAYDQMQALKARLRI